MYLNKNVEMLNSKIEYPPFLEILERCGNDRNVLVCISVVSLVQAQSVKNLSVCKKKGLSKQKEKAESQE